LPKPTLIQSATSLIGYSGANERFQVKHILVDGANMIKSTKAVGIKLYQGGSDHGTATVTNVTYQNVVVDACDYAAQIESCYGSSDAASCAAAPSAAQLSQIYFKGFSGKT
jgi:galacturan 1,4-alpha-galacturonidase